MNLNILANQYYIVLDIIEVIVATICVNTL